MSEAAKDAKGQESQQPLQRLRRLCRLALRSAPRAASPLARVHRPDPRPGRARSRLAAAIMSLRRGAVRARRAPRVARPADQRGSQRRWDRVTAAPAASRAP